VCLAVARRKKEQALAESPSDTAESTLEIPVIELIVQPGRVRTADFDDPAAEAEAPPARALASMPSPSLPHEQVIYETPRGSVRQVGSGPSRQFYLTRRLDDGREEVQPFSGEMVDEAVREVDMEAPARIPAERIPVEPDAEHDAGPAGTWHDYEGDVHDVIDVEGIGKVYAERLNESGVFTTARLRHESAADLARWTQAPEATARQWQVMAELIAVKGVGPQYAEAMARAGVSGIAELADRKPADIAAQVTAYLNGLGSAVLGNEVTARRVKGWQKAAKRMRRIGMPVPAR
jgi:predicted flap endonuclease-1-like 5' DNA nuclease